MAEETKNESTETDEIKVPVEQTEVDSSEKVGDTETNIPDETEEVVVSIGNEDSPSSGDDTKDAPEWVRELRKDYRIQKKKNRDLEKQLEALTAPKDIETLGPKPTFKDYGFGEEEKFEADLEGWHSRKKAIQEKVDRQKAAEEQQKQEWEAELEKYKAKKSKLKISNFEELEAVVQESLSFVQQGIIVQGAEDSAKIVAALGLNPAKLNELSKIKDPVKFSFAVAKLETQLKVTTRKALTSPEKKVRGDASISAAVDSTLERLRAEAAKSGDYSKVIQYKALKRRPS